MATKTTLLVPLRIDALYVESAGLQFGATMADFSTLPYYLANGQPQNKQTPNLAESVVDQTTSLEFPKGLHLHWALPDALTTGYHRGDETAFPAVPNRWLVRRLDHNGQLQQSMIVESDFLYPLDNNGAPTYAPNSAWPPITFPTKRQQVSQDKLGAGFRYMGRTQSLEDWLKPSPGSEYLNHRDNNSKYKFSDYPLTAVGYGEPSFAAYYPNCYSVFGFCDRDVALQEGSSYEYQIIGWINETDLDPLQSAELAGLNDDAARYNALQVEYKWFLDAADQTKPFPAVALFYGSLTVTPNKVTRWKSKDEQTPRIAIGNTGGEALAALLADELTTPDNKVTVEDQLEAINVSAALQGVEIDYAAHFAQTRHQRGFRGLAGGSRWAVVPAQTLLQPITPAAANKDAETQPPLPDAVAHALDALNTAQEDYDKAQQEIVELRYQTFCDWHKFLIAAYSDAIDLAPFTAQKTNLAQYISDQTLKLLNQKINVAGKLVLDKDFAKADGVTLTLASNTISPADPANENLAVQVLLRFHALIDTLIAANITDKFEIRNQAADHFWRPSEPVVLLSGPVAVSTPRHGEDGNLACNVIDLPDAPGTKAFLDAVGNIKPVTPNNPFVQTQSNFPWHPIILEWSVAVSPVQTGRPPNGCMNGARDYESTFLSASFQLQQNEPDFSRPGTLPLLVPNQYDGRCLMTPTATTQLDTNLRTFLIRTTLDDCRDRAAAAEPDYVDRLIAWYQIKHNVKPPENKSLWLKQQKPFIDDGKKDADGNPVLLPDKDLLAWYTDKPVNGANNTVGKWDATQQAQDPIYSAIRALNQLDGMPVLSQALGGFNAALMTRRQFLQIPIENPVEQDLLPREFFKNLDLTNHVAAAVGRHHPTAPRFARVFSPIRSGTLGLQSLRLKDTFGQQWSMEDPTNVVTSDSLSDARLGANTTYLPPRFSTPARLNFRWLAAMSGQNGIDEVEMNSAPVTTPICGWLLPNNFDNSLMVYDNTGKALGSINLLAEWSPAPGDNDRITVDQIANLHLQRVVRRLVVDVGMGTKETGLRQDFLASFLSTLDSALEAIEPASFAQHEALALLMGRPIAVVRARVDLQLMGQPTHAETIDDATIPSGKAIRLQESQHWKSFVDQDWNVFAYDWGKFYGCDYNQIMKTQSCLFRPQNNDDYQRTTHGFEKVSVPMRLGEHQLLNDGLVGFCKETPGGELDNVFHAPQTLDDIRISDDVTYKEGLTTPCIRAYVKGVTDNLSLTLQDDPLGLTILMDPRGVVHATSGVLPVYKLEIPSVYYADVLKRMGVTFRVSPILTDSEELHVAAPKEAGYEWSWITQPQVSKWEETTIIADATEHAHFFKPPKIVEGWLKLTPKKEHKKN